MATLILRLPELTHIKIKEKDYLDKEAKNATRVDFDKVMRAVPDVETEEYDKL